MRVSLIELADATSHLFAPHHPGQCVRIHIAEPRRLHPMKSGDVKMNEARNILFRAETVDGHLEWTIELADS